MKKKSSFCKFYMADESSRKIVALGSLKNLNLKEVEQLSRNQLKEVLGGNIGGGTTSPNVDCKCADSSRACCVQRGHPRHAEICEKCCEGTLT